MNPIAEQRKRLGITQAQLAEALNIDRTTVSKWEAGASAPRAKLLPRLAKELGTSVDQLLDEAI